jgi:hypothetical protein
MDGVDAEDVLDLIAALEGKGLAPKTVRNVIGTLFGAVRVRQGAAAGVGRGQPV